MMDQLILAIGVDYAIEDEKQGRDTPSVKAALRAFRPALAVSEIENNKATLTFDNYDDAEELIKETYKYCSDINDHRTPETTLYFTILLIIGDTNAPVIFAKAANMLASLVQKGREQASIYPVRVYITHETYEHLAPHHQDLYHSAIEVASTVVHQRFSEDAQRCFVVSPIGSEGSETRKRADLVYERYIKLACETTSFRPIRGEMMRGNYILSDVLDALQSDPMVIVYLGPPKLGWNPNVMIELGSRITTGAPYIVIKDSTSNGKPYDLPFDLKDDRVIDIPEDEENNPELAAIKIRTIRERIRDIVPPEWDDIYPTATVDMKIGDPTGEASKYTDASRQTETLFDLKRIIGKEVLFVIQHLLEMMPSCQRQPFIEEQQNLIAKLLVPTLGGIQSVRATIPIVFQTHPKYKGRAFLPIITRYNLNKPTNVLRIRVLYVEVTSATKLDEKGHYVCTLTGDKAIDLSGRQPLKP
jgi:hypothetical protein